MCISLKHSHDNAIDDDEDVNVEKLNNYNNLCSTNVEQMLLFQVLNISFFFSIHTEKHDDANYSYTNRPNTTDEMLFVVKRIWD